MQKDATGESRSASASFVMISRFQPGLIQAKLRSWELQIEFPDAVKHHFTGDDDRLLTNAADFDNITLGYVIGPAVPPDATKADVLKMIR